MFRLANKVRGQLRGFERRKRGAVAIRQPSVMTDAVEHVVHLAGDHAQLVVPPPARRGGDDGCDDDARGAARRRRATARRGNRARRAWRWSRAQHESVTKR